MNVIDTFRVDTPLFQEIGPVPRTAPRIDDRAPQVARPLGDKPLIQFVRVCHRSKQRRVFLRATGVCIQNHIASHGTESRRSPVDVTLRYPGARSGRSPVSWAAGDVRLADQQARGKQTVTGFGSVWVSLENACHRLRV